MKPNVHYCVILLLFLLFVAASPRSSARFLATKQGEVERRLNGKAGGSFMESSDAMNQLIGLEICDNGDEECLKRRIVAEAHLDYIYTQHHKP